MLKSVEDPLATGTANAHGTVAVLGAAVAPGWAGGVCLPEQRVLSIRCAPSAFESAAPILRSPYAVSKLTAKQYGRVFAGCYGLDTVTLCYFNVLGPLQRPDSVDAG